MVLEDELGDILGKAISDKKTESEESYLSNGA